MRETASIITVGTELVTGLRLDTNTRDIAAHLTGSGYEVVEAMSVGDDIDRLTGAVRRLARDCEALVITGGLGPTHDDITREGVASALDVELLMNDELAVGLESIALRHADPAAAAQVAKQAMVLEGASVLPATSGTAPGQILEIEGCRIVLLPGPPHEMKPMLRLAFASSASSAAPRVLRTVGMGESDVQVRAQRAISEEGVALTVLASPSLVDVVLVDEGGGDGALDSAREAVIEALGEYIYAEGEATLPEHVIELARSKGKTIACAESCTGGLIGAALTDVPGASAVFVGGIIAYSNDVKTGLLGVDADLIATQGAVSGAVAEQMALGALNSLGADLAVSTTGVAGPDGGTDEKPVGTVWLGVAGRGSSSSEMRSLFGDRSGVRIRARIAALNLLRKSLLRGE